MIIRQATSKDVIEYFGRQFQQSMRGLVAEHEGQLLGVTGVLHTTPLQAFSEMRPEMSHYPVTIGKAARRFKAILRGYNAPVYAIPSHQHPRARHMLEWMGFEKVNEDLYEWNQ